MPAKALCGAPLPLCAAACKLARPSTASLLDPCCKDHHTLDLGRLQDVFSYEPLTALKERVAQVVTEANKTPLEDDDEYARAFVQASLLPAEMKMSLCSCMCADVRLASCADTSLSCQLVSEYG